MAVTELMVGDWFCMNGKDQQVKSVKHLNDLQILSDAGVKIEPIEITKEILIKNGLRAGISSIIDLPNGIHFEYYIHAHRIRLRWDNHQGIDDILIQCNVRYVHELQNLLRLCKIDKEIKL